MTAVLSSNALRTALSRAFDASADLPCSAAHAALGRLRCTWWSSDEHMRAVFRDAAEYPHFDARQWLGETCGYYPEVMNADFKRLTGKTRDEWLALVGWR